MISYIRAGIRGWLAPSHKLSCRTTLWDRSLRELRRRGQGVRESGAFLLGTERDGRRQVQHFVFYDDIDPRALDSGIIRFKGTAFSNLWTVSEQLGCSVVGDVHTHPGNPRQSRADAEHPMISKAGHLSLIVPNFAQAVVPANEIGLYEYLGGRRWKDHSGPGADRVFYIGWWG